MKMPRKIQSFLTLAALLGLILPTSGCLFSPTDGDRPDPPIDEPILLNSPANVLDALVETYIAKDILEYPELFDADQFLFVFDPEEAQNPKNNLPTSWGWSDELDSTEGMFESEYVLDIKLDFVKGPKLATVESDLVPLEWSKIVCTEVELEIDTIDPNGGENIIYKVTGDRGTYFFQEYPEEVIEGLSRYRIVEWRDLHVG